MLKKSFKKVNDHDNVRTPEDDTLCSIYSRLTATLEDVLSETEAILSSLTVQYQAIFNLKELSLLSDCNVLDMYANSKARVSLHIVVNNSAHY